MVQIAPGHCWQNFATRIRDLLCFVLLGLIFGWNTNQLKQAIPLKLPSKDYWIHPVSYFLMTYPLPFDAHNTLL